MKKEKDEDNYIITPEKTGRGDKCNLIIVPHYVLDGIGAEYDIHNVAITDEHIAMNMVPECVPSNILEGVLTEDDSSIEPKMTPIITPMILPISGLPVGHPNIQLFKEAQSFHKIIGQAYEVLKDKKKK